jgi:hypothetical protein
MLEQTVTALQIKVRIYLVAKILIPQALNGFAAVTQEVLRTHVLRY